MRIENVTPGDTIEPGGVVVKRPVISTTRTWWGKTRHMVTVTLIVRSIVPYDTTLTCPLGTEVNVITYEDWKRENV